MVQLDGGSVGWWFSSTVVHLHGGLVAQGVSHTVVKVNRVEMHGGLVARGFS